MRFVWRFLLFSLLAAAGWRLFVPAHLHFVEAVQTLVAYGAEGTGLTADVHAAGLVRFDGSFAYIITTGCTGMNMVFLYAAAVFAYPAAFRSRLVGLAVGVPALLAANLVRLIAMAQIGVRHHAAYEQFHVLWAQGILIVGVALAWLAWVTWSQRYEARRAALGLPRVLLAVAVFTIVFAALAAVGSLGITGPYGRLVLSVASWSAPYIIGHPVVEAPPHVVEYYSGLWFTGAAAVAALYLASPRAPLLRRLVAGVGLGVPSTLLMQVFWVLARSRAPIGNDVTFSTFFSFGLETMVPVVVWFFWARSQWNRNAPLREPTTCPACGIHDEDVRGHIRVEHAHNANRLINRLACAREGR